MVTQRTTSMTDPSGRALAAQRRQVSHTCPVCGQTFTALKTARFCSNRCRQAAKYQRQKSKTLS